MLELKNIVKDYPAGGETVHALRGIDLKFRECDFVSILGPSGCGKTTLLNLIGGLDRYTSGDLIINGKSTKDFKDRDWDGYRNHSVGFVFQSYNLIPHQNVLSNVELALTLSGVSKKERRKRAKEALEAVGLGNQLRKRPAEMSGGQMQRVAIARAIVNDPDIILADEPTGALDTETSVQVMEILKKISQNRLVIMVTHNPDLAERYSTRIIRMLDGTIIGDSNPLSEEESVRFAEIDGERARIKKKEKKPSMSFFTGFSLSLRNLFTKKGRTALTGFAGSIGIIGIALIYAVSQGTTNYINAVQEDTLSSYPLVIESQHIDMGTLLTTFMGNAESDNVHENDAVYQKSMMYDMMNSLNSLEAETNDLKAFKSYIEREKSTEGSLLNGALSAVQYTYDLNLLIYTKNIDGEIIRSDSSTLMSGLVSEYMGSSALSASSASSMLGSSSRSSSLWQEMLPGENGELVGDIVKGQYDVIYGRWPEKSNEIVLVLDSRNELADISLYALGLRSKDDINEIMKAAMSKKQIEYTSQSWSYEEVCDRDFRVILSPDCYVEDETGVYSDLRDTDSGLRYLYDKAMSLKVCGIIRPNPDASSTMLSGSVAYTHALTEDVIQKSYSSAAAEAQKATPEIDIFSGLPFRPEEKNMTDADKAAYFKDHVSAFDNEEKADLYLRILSVPSEEMIQSAVASSMAGMTRADMEMALISAVTVEMGMDEATVKGYISSMSDEEVSEMIAKAISDQVTEQYAASVEARTSMMTTEQLAAAFDGALGSFDEETCADYYDELLDFSSSNYERNFKKLGCVDIDTPSSISLYAATFAAKDRIKDAISDYNKTVDELEKISYTDYVGIIMSSVTTIIDAITYVLIAFVSVSLVVSSIMIGVITLISVQERTKEIGILRALGASKKNVSSMFNAETVIIGFLSGAIGVGITWLLCIPINLILHAVTGIQSLNATLPLPVGIILVIISMMLTLIAGIIPSRSAARKDPVVALRTE